MRQYIDLLCGDLDVLKDNPLDIRTKDEMLSASKKVVYEYSRIVDAASTRVNLNKRVSRATELLKMQFFRVCLKMMSINAFDDVRAILSDYGLRTKAMTNEQLIAEVKRQYLRCSTNIKRMASAEKTDEAEPTPDEIRVSFDQQAASLMTYFKFQIDLSTIKATTFAYMVQQANREIKARMAALNKH